MHIIHLYLRVSCIVNHWFYFVESAEYPLYTHIFINLEISMKSYKRDWKMVPIQRYLHLVSYKYNTYFRLFSLFYLCFYKCYSYTIVLRNDSSNCVVDGGIPRKYGWFIMRVVMFTVHFSGYTSLHRKIVTVISYHLGLNALLLAKIQIDITLTVKRGYYEFQGISYFSAL